MNRHFLFSILLLIMVGLLSISFYQTTAADDFGIYNICRQLGLGNGIVFFYENGNGRFFSMPAQFILLNSSWVMQHYWIIPVTIILLYWGSVIYLSHYFLTYIFRNSFCKYRIFFTGTFLSVIIASCMPEVSSAFYWASASLTYFLGFAFFCFFLVAITKLITGHYRSRALLISCLVILVIINCGSNEVLAFYILLLLIYSIIFSIKEKREWIVLGALLTVGIAATSILLFSPGNVIKSQNFAAAISLVNSLKIGVFQVAKVFFFIIRSPLFWILVLSLIPFSKDLNETIKTKIYRADYQIFFLSGLFFVTAFIVFFTVIHYLSAWHLPARALNVLIACSILLFIPFIIFLFVKNEKIIERFHFRSPIVRVIILLAFIFNPFTIDLVKTLISAPVHLQLVRQREAKIFEAKKSDKRSVIISSYAEGMKAIRRDYFKNNSTLLAVEKYIPARPPFVYFVNDPCIDPFCYSYAEYYKIDTLISPLGLILRQGLLPEKGLLY